jgi:hypothetical protein
VTTGLQVPIQGEFLWIHSEKLSEFLFLSTQWLSPVTVARHIRVDFLLTHRLTCHFGNSVGLYTNESTTVVVDSEVVYPTW